MDNNTHDKKGARDADSLYIQNVTYNDAEHSSFVKKYVDNMRVIALIMVTIILIGVVSFVRIPRTLMPEVNIAMVSVVTVMPGATPEDIESLVTEVIESEVAKVDDVDEVTSTSLENVSTVMVQFHDGVDVDKAQTDVQNAISSIATLPDAAHTPQVSALDFEDRPILQYAVIANDMDAASLNSFVESLVDDLEDQPLIDRVEIAGNEEQEVQILITEQVLKELHINIQSVASRITQSLSSIPAGAVYTDTLKIGLTIDRDSMTLDDVRHIIIPIDGIYYRLGDIAEVAEVSTPDNAPAFITRTDGTEHRAITLNVYRIIGSKIADATKESFSVMDAYKKQAGDHVSFVKITNTDEKITDQFNKLYRNMISTVILVFIVLFLFVGARQALLASLSVPLVFMLAFGVMYVTGLTMNFVSIFALLLSLGLLVDVTIVIIAALTNYYRSGRFSAQETALLVWKDYFSTLLVTTLTTVWAFLPLLLSTGIIGEFIKSIPIVVSAILMISVLIGFFVILPLMVWLFDFAMPRRVKTFLYIIAFLIVCIIVRGLFLHYDIHFPFFAWLVIMPVVVALLFSCGVLVKGMSTYIKKICYVRARKLHDVCSRAIGSGVINVTHLSRVYKSVLTRLLHKKWSRRSVVISVVTFFFFGIFLVVGGFVKNEFFPASDEEQIYVNITLPLDTRARVSQEVARDFVAGIVDDVDGVAEIQTQIGAEFGAKGNVSVGGADNKILVTLNLIDEDVRDMTSVHIAQQLRNTDVVKNFTQGEISVDEISSGPPAGADVTIKLIGPQFEKLNDYAFDIMGQLENIDGVVNIKKSIKSGSSKIVFVPHVQDIHAHGLTVPQIGSFLYTFGSGMVVAEDVDFTHLSNKRDVVLRFSRDNASIDALEHLMITSQTGEQVPLVSLGEFRMEDNPSEIAHEDQTRILTVTASVEEEYNAAEINKGIATYINENIHFAHGYTWATGGANEENQKSVTSILQAMVVALVLIFITLIVQLDSYRKSFIVLLVIPLAISGVFLLFAIFGIALSFPALIGVLALFGIVINNSIMIIDQINKNHRANMTFHDAVVDGASSRLEPIVLSSLTTIFGLLPITLSEPMWQGLGGAIICGLVFSGVIMLFFIPSVYYMMMESAYKR
ncbi:MAG: hypothetical protein CR972_04455 [Candidatus Moraniibacteriota bacterium]|nr:MAG: hypothetical protein CR972_04455 [Candidatus Moranbacteria bacterium]